MCMSQLRYGGLPPRRPRKAKESPSTHSSGDPNPSHVQSEEITTTLCCPHCGKPLIGNGQRERKSGAAVRRFRCRKCNYHLSVPPPTHEPHRVMPVAYEDAAVLDYAVGKGVCAQLAERYGVCTTTLWNWVNRAAMAGRVWINIIPQEILYYDPIAQIVPAPTEGIIQRMRPRRFRLPGRPEEIVQLLSVARWAHQLQAQLVTLGWSVSHGTSALQFCRQYFRDS